MIKAAIERALAVRKTLSTIPGIEILDPDRTKYPTSDPTKICFIAKKDDGIEVMNGEDMRNFMRKNYKVDPEEFRKKCVLVSCHLGTT